MDRKWRKYWKFDFRTYSFDFSESSFQVGQTISFKVIISENMKNLKIVILGEGCAENEIFNDWNEIGVCLSSIKMVYFYYK